MNIKSFDRLKVGQTEQKNKTMKKNLIYTVTFLLCGAMFFSSCEDMLEVDSNRVEYNYGGWTFNDSVYSVLGILKSVQNIGDRHVLLNELRGDLLTVNAEMLKDADLSDIVNFNFNPNSNKYLAAKDYYSVINNCNIFLARVDTTLTYDNMRLMLREYVAVKSVRAWTYLQLMKNHGQIPFITKPITSHADAEEAMAATPADQLTVLDALIEDIAPYENPKAYNMPLWSITGFSLLDGIPTSKLFMPIRVLLGDLYLWRAAIKAEYTTYPLTAPDFQSDYMKAAQCYYMYLTEDNPQGDTSNRSSHTVGDNDDYNPDKNISYPSYDFVNIFTQNDLTTKYKNLVAFIPFATNENTGVVSALDKVFAPEGEMGTAQVVSSQAMANISAAQSYVKRVQGATEAQDKFYPITSKIFPGDLRLYSTTAYQLGIDEAKTRHNGIITKFNVEDKKMLRTSEQALMVASTVKTNKVVLDRPENIYLRFAEALLGLEREGFSGAKELAMTVLKSGVKDEYKLWWQPDTVVTPRLDEDGKAMTMPLYSIAASAANKEFGSTHVYVYKLNSKGEYIKDENGANKKFYQYVPVHDEIISSREGYEPVVFDFSDNVFFYNEGIHSRGSGYTAKNDYYALTDSCVAKHYGIESTGNKIQVATNNVDATGALCYVPVANEGKSYLKLDEAADPANGVYKLDARGNVKYTISAKVAEADEYIINDEQRVNFMYDKLIDEMALEMAWEGHRFGDLVRFAISLGEPDFLAKRVAARDGEMNDNLRTHLNSKDNWYIPLPDNYIPEEK